MPFLGELSAFVTACCWSVSALVFAAATRRAGSFQVNITRLILAVGYLAVPIALFRIPTDLSASQVLYLSLSGVVGLTLGDTFLFRAFQEIGARISMLIMSLAPAIAAFLSYLFLGETLTVTSVLGIGVTVAGVAIVVLGRSEASAGGPAFTPAGALYALLGAAGQGGGLIFAKMAFQESDINGFVATMVRIIASLVLLLPAALLTRRFQDPLRMYREDRKAFGLTALGALLGPFLGISLSLVAVAHTLVGVAATIMAIVPVLMLPLVRFVYRERLGWRAIGGACIAVAGVCLLFLR